jgi:hypothetical protein
MFSVHLAQAVNDYKIDHAGDPNDENLARLDEYYGTLYKAMWTLFQVVSDGVNWRNCTMCLLDIHWSYGILMALYKSFCTCAILNIVTGIFVNAAIQCAKEDQDVAISDAMESESSYAQSLLRVFTEADIDKNGMLDTEEFDMHLEDRRVRAYLHHLGLQVDEAKGLFRLLDIGNTGKVDRKEFVLGCMRLKGPAKNVDVATLLYENKRMCELWTHFMVYVEEQFAFLTTSGSEVNVNLPAPAGLIEEDFKSPAPSVATHSSIGKELVMEAEI